MRILIVTGGDNDEREISFLSANNVKKSLLKNCHHADLFDYSLGLEKLSEIVSDYELIFPVLHGIEGEGGDLQKFLEDKKIRFVGSSSKACKNGWDKIAFKKFCDKNNILTADWQIINNEKEISLPLPYVIKTPNEGSSVNIYLVKNDDDLKKINFKKLFKTNKELLVEKFIPGIEVTVGIFKNDVLPPIEIVPPDGEMFDYKNKYNGKTQEIPNAPSLNELQKKRVGEIAHKIHFDLECKDFSRTDFIVNGENIYALEINTIPGLTQESLFPKAAKSAGMNFDELICELIKK
jgi:D-alanine-D-alanine ligase